MVNALYCADAHCVANHFAVLEQLKAFLREGSATTAINYSLIAGGIALAIIAVVTGTYQVPPSPGHDD